MAARQRYLAGCLGKIAKPPNPRSGPIEWRVRFAPIGAHRTSAMQGVIDDFQDRRGIGHHVVTGPMLDVHLAPSCRNQLSAVLRQSAVKGSLSEITAWIGPVLVQIEAKPSSIPTHS